MRLMAAAGGRQAVFRRGLQTWHRPRAVNPPPLDQFTHQLVRQAEGNPELSGQRALRHGSAGFELTQNPPLLYLMAGEGRHFVPVTHTRGRACYPKLPVRGPEFVQEMNAGLCPKQRYLSRMPRPS